MTDPDYSWTLTVAYQNGRTSVSGANGASADETVYRGETDQITFLPGTGVRAVTGINITSPTPLPSTVTITPQVSGNNLIVTDVDSLAADDNEVQVSYCVLFTDSNGNPVVSDPKLINKPSTRQPS